MLPVSALKPISLTANPSISETKNHLTTMGTTYRRSTSMTSWRRHLITWWIITTCKTIAPTSSDSGSMTNTSKKARKRDQSSYTSVESTGAVSLRPVSTHSCLAPHTVPAFSSLSTDSTEIRSHSMTGAWKTSHTSPHSRHFLIWHTSSVQ